MRSELCNGFGLEDLYDEGEYFETKPNLALGETAVRSIERGVEFMNALLNYADGVEQ